MRVFILLIALAFLAGCGQPQAQPKQTVAFPKITVKAQGTYTPAPTPAPEKKDK